LWGAQTWGGLTFLSCTLSNGTFKKIWIGILFFYVWNWSIYIIVFSRTPQGILSRGLCSPLQQLRISKHNIESQTSLHCLAHATNVTWQLPFTTTDLKNMTTSGAT
jgi:hypothetical protein